MHHPPCHALSHLERMEEMDRPKKMARWVVLLRGGFYPKMTQWPVPYSYWKSIP
jgi:hypothetical protein